MQQREPTVRSRDADRLGALSGWIGWTSAAIGIAIGLVIGLWSFDGPLAVPEWLGGYGDTPRRLLRLGHIAAIALGLINVVLSRDAVHLALPSGVRRIMLGSMCFGNVALPLTLFAAAAWHPAKYAMPLPAVAVLIALAAAAYGARPGARR